MDIFIKLMMLFSEHQIDAQEFQDRYLDAWNEYVLNEKAFHLDEDEKKRVEAAFYIAEAITIDEQLLQHPVYSQFSINENEARKRIKELIPT